MHVALRTIDIVKSVNPWSSEKQGRSTPLGRLKSLCFNNAQLNNALAAVSQRQINYSRPGETEKKTQ